MDFKMYLKSKKIDPLTFQKADPALWHEFKLIFDQVHPDSFTAQKLFLINSIRRKYPLQEEPEDKGNITGRGETDKKTMQPKPKFNSPSVEAGKAKPKVRMVPKIKKKEE